jgi:hypothetical protein
MSKPQHVVKDIDGILREYDSLLMEANRKNVMLTVAMNELSAENEKLKVELEKANAKQDEAK